MEKLGPRVRVRSVQPLRGFTALITFENGAQREINLEPYFHGPIFEPIRNNPSMFSSIKIEGGTIAWDNGADIDADHGTQRRFGWLFVGAAPGLIAEITSAE